MREGEKKELESAGNLQGRSGLSICSLNSEGEILPVLHGKPCVSVGVRLQTKI